MRVVLLIFGFICLTFTNSFGQKKTPKNLQQTIKFLDEDSLAGLKNLVKITENENLINWDKKIRIIDSWLDDKKSGINKYFTQKGINNFKFKQKIILENYKKHLSNEPINEALLLKPYLELEKKWSEEDKNRKTTDTLRGVYIPKDLEDCFIQINSFWHDSTKTKIKNWTEEEFSCNAHFGFGMSIRNNWQLWGGSRLSKYFNDLGISHPDHMSGIIVHSFHRYLNDKEIKLEEQVKHYQDYWEETEKKELKKEQDKFSTYQIGDTLEFLYNKGFVSKEQKDKYYDGYICIARGIIIERNEEKFLIKVKVIETCDKKGIIYYDNNGYERYDAKTKKWITPPKRIIKKMKINQTQWFYYADWRNNTGE